MPLPKRLPPLLLLVAFSALPAVADTPSTAPAPAAKADYSTPRKAVQTFLRAQDDAALRDALIIPPASATQIDAFLGVMVSTIELQKTAEAQFGSSASRFFSKATAEQLDARIKSVETAELQTKGDSAIITLPADETTRQSSATISLQKTAGAWKINADSVFSIDASAKTETARRVELALTLDKVTRQMMADIAAHKFNSAADAYQEYWSRSRDAVSSLGGSATRPASPTTHP